MAEQTPPLQGSPPWWKLLCSWLYKLMGILGGAIMVPLVLDLLRGTNLTDSLFGRLVTHQWHITVLVGCCLLLLAALTYVLSQWQVNETASPSQQNHRILLDRLRCSYDDMMKKSLQGIAWLELGFARKPDAVQNTSNLQLRVPHRADQSLPAGTSILEAYDQAGQELLILGEPGAGKSTQLYNLAQQLVARAEQDKMQPLPVILSLSSWAIKRPPLQDWLAEQVALFYLITEPIARRWVQENVLLPLLDGLDEVEETARPACVAAINTYHQAHPNVHLVVCSRKTEYEAVAKKQRLTLQMAIIVQPLTKEQVNAYLEQAGKPLDALRRALKRNRALQELATTPLMLTILMLTYQGTSVRALPSKERQVWTAYVNCMVELKGNSKRYPLAQTCVWLGWLARQMQDHNQTDFYLEYMQPNWLPTKQQHVYTWLALRLPGIMIGILVSVVVSLFLNFSSSVVFPAFIQPALVGGFLGGLLSDTTAKSLSCQSMPGHPRRSLKMKHVVTSICMGLAYGFSFRLYPNSESYYGPNDWLRDGSIFGIVVGLSCWLLLSLQPSFFSQQRQVPSKSMRQPWLHRLRPTPYGQRILVLTAVFGGAMGLSQGLCDGLNDGLKTGLGNELSTGLSVLVSRGLTSGLSYGFISVLISLILVRMQAREVHLVDRLHWSWRNILKSLAERSHLRRTMQLAGNIALLAGLSVGLGQVLSIGLRLGFIDGLSDTLNYVLSQGLINGLKIVLAHGLGYGLTIGLNYWLLVGLFEGIKSESIIDKERCVPNEGIRQSIRNSLVVGLISGSLIVVSIGPSGWLFYILSRGLDYGLNAGLSHGLSYGLSYGLKTGANYGLIGLGYGLSKAWLIGCCVCFLAGAGKGGLAVFRHAVLRILLWQTHRFPLKASAFLDDAIARILLRRSIGGGGYSFIHQLLLKYFADPNTTASSIQPTKASPP